MPCLVCLHRKRINISTVLAGQRLDIKEVGEGIWLASFLALRPPPSPSSTGHTHGISSVPLILPRYRGSGDFQHCGGSEGVAHQHLAVAVGFSPTVRFIYPHWLFVFEVSLRLGRPAPARPVDELASPRH